MKNIPNKIYLNINDADGDFNDMIDVTWSDSRINDFDIEYILSEQQPDNQQQKSDNEQLNIAGVSNQRELLSQFAIFFAKNMERGKTPAILVNEFYEALGNSC